MDKDKAEIEILDLFWGNGKNKPAYEKRQQLKIILEELQTQSKMEKVENNTQTLEERYIRLYEFTRNVLLANHLPSDFEDNYELRLAEETIKVICKNEI